MSQDQSMYYVSLNEKVQGPYTFAQLQQLMLTNQITRKTQVLLQGSPSWINAQQIPGLFPQFHAEEPSVIPTLRSNPNPRPVPPVSSSFPINPNSEPSLDFSQPKLRRAVLLEEEEEDEEEKLPQKIHLNSKWMYGVWTYFLPGMGHIFLNEAMKGSLILIISLILILSRVCCNLSEEIEVKVLGIILGIPFYMFFTFVFLDCMATYDKIDFKQNSKKAAKLKTKNKKRSLKQREVVFIILWIFYFFYLCLFAISLNYNDEYSSSNAEQNQYEYVNQEEDRHISPEEAALTIFFTAAALAEQTR